MSKKNIESIFYDFVKKDEIIEIKENKIGYINNTFFIKTKKSDYVLQKLSPIFNRENICFNIKQVFSFLESIKNNGKIKTEFKILTPIFLDNKENCIKKDGEIYRLYRFIENSIVLNEINIENAENIGEGIGEFYSYLNGFNGVIKESFKHFHDIKYYYENYIKLEKKYNIGENKELKEITKWISSKDKLIKKYIFLLNKLPNRLIHQDMKLSNMLFDNSGKNLISIIDWDTFGLGSILIDFGDMCRSFIVKMNYDLEIFELFLKGYFSKMKDILTLEEKQNLLLAFEMINLELAIRYLNQYFGDEKVFNLDNNEILQNVLKLYNTAKFIEDNKIKLKEIIFKYI